MLDYLTPLQRYKCMASIRSRKTKPDVKLHKELFRLGYRYYISGKSLPDKLDIELLKYHACVFVNGCFW